MELKEGYSHNIHRIIVILDMIIAVLITLGAFTIIGSQLGLLLLLFALCTVILTIVLKAI
jgi:hypothetical protein